MPDEDKIDFDVKKIYTLLNGKMLYGLFPKLDCLHITRRSLVFEKSRWLGDVVPGVMVYLSSDG